MTDVGEIETMLPSDGSMQYDELRERFLSLFGELPTLQRENLKNSTIDEVVEWCESVDMCGNVNGCYHIADYKSRVCVMSSWHTLQEALQEFDLDIDDFIECNGLAFGKLDVLIREYLLPQVIDDLRQEKLI